MTYKEARAKGLCGQCRTYPAVEGRTSCPGCVEYRARMVEGLHVPPEERAAWKEKFAASRRKKIHEWQKGNPSKMREYRAADRRKLKDRVFDYYGRSCVCCGEVRQEFLTIDHVDGGGREHRRKINNDLYRWLVKKTFPKGFQVLCMNCNFAKRESKECPHAVEADFVWVRRSYEVGQELQ